MMIKVQYTSDWERKKDFAIGIKTIEELFDWIKEQDFEVIFREVGGEIRLELIDDYLH